MYVTSLWKEERALDLLVVYRKVWQTGHGPQIHELYIFAKLNQAEGWNTQSSQIETCTETARRLARNLRRLLREYLQNNRDISHRIRRTVTLKALTSQKVQEYLGSGNRSHTKALKLCTKIAKRSNLQITPKFLVGNSDGRHASHLLNT